MARAPRPLRTSQLRRTVKADSLGFEDTASLKPLASIIEQPRSFEALRLGGTMSHRNYNIYVAGLPGTGKLTAVRKILDKIAIDREAPGDVCFVHNFKTPYESIALFFERGKGGAFKKVFEELIRQLLVRLPQVYHSREYQTLLQQLVNRGMEQENEAFLELSELAKGMGFSVKTTKSGLMTVPLYSNRALSDKDYERLPPEAKRQIEDNRRKLTPHVQGFLQKTRELQMQTHNGVEYLQKQLIEQLVQPEIERLKVEFGANDGIRAFLDSVMAEMQDKPQAMLPSDDGPESPASWRKRFDELKEFHVNLLVDNAETEGAPVLYEKNPTFPNLVGKIDKVVEQGAYHSNFTMIRPGSILRANGGFLLINALDILTKPYAWQALKNVLKNRELTIEDFSEQYGFPPTTGLKPAPISVDLKVVLMGSSYIHALLVHHDDDFQKLFQIKSEFDVETAATKTNLKLFSRFVTTICEKDDLRPIHKTGIAALMEFSMREVEHRDKLSLQFSSLSNLVLESEYFAGRAGAEKVEAEHVEEAIQARRERVSLMSDKVHELFERETLLIDVVGGEVGQINGLAVLQMPDYAFGKPVRITAQAFAGRGGVVSIEREARMAGKVFTKASLIISSYLRSLFAQDDPLSLNVSIAFEQSYGGIDGDSASLAEVYAVLSAISERPVAQGIAITGSMNQKGDVQAIGGVNEKIEGFFRICKERGLTGEQGVIVPRANVQNLMLDHEVVAASEAGLFRVWGIERIEQGAPILFGLQAGARRKDGRYSKDSLFALCDHKLEALREAEKKRKQDAADAPG
jgi:lon-related putative ATP-dependent protease